ncbi:hypothetical protein PLESTB_001626800 [Pleodorina starrii]|uniref:Uncharacterized protein n=1 Tax=Pleodorina starrii TaxID=330485 RepID=A0A9W6BYK8_9CHLO|nr:hypothetical protein PLESTM_000912000 [Pleodorina starrii]GLC60559.1 hypothetical protein PLESTB_001626800 [Pleodorina starrii]GLC77139.1 hypothetical protein PLESTF_001890500 [Pleodorina starrii]
MDTIEQLLQRGQQAQGGGVAQALLSAPEAEQIIGQLAPLTIEEVGGPKWHAQHDWIERLNLQAHYNAQTHSDEFVVELLVSLDKLHLLVHDMLLIEAWKQFVYPLLSAHLADQVDSVTTYLLIYHEVTVANLLQVALFHSHAAESLSEDYSVELADWCYRKLTGLNAEGHKLAEHRERGAEELLHMSRLDEQEEKRREVEFSVMMCSLTILRYITDSLPRMAMGALSRVVSTNDTLMALLPLLDRPPWVRTLVPPGAGGGRGRPVLEKWWGNRWVAVPPADRLKITQTDGQVWLAVTNLLVEPRCRAKYGMDEFRRERILGLKRHLNELMFDQLPVLKDLQRVLDELALGVLPDPSGAGKSAALILEAVPVVRDSILRGRDWRAVAERAREEHFGRAAARMARERMEAMVKHLDFLCELEPEPAAAAAAAAGQAADGAAGGAAEPPPPVKISTWRKVHDSGVYESWYDFSMEVDDSRPPEPVEVAAANAGAAAAAAAGTSGGGGGGAVVAAVHGLRYRLRPLDVDSTRPLPANGKAVVRWGSLVSEALLQLPELPTRDSGEGAAVLWVTVGLLAVEGLVLQIKLKKAAKPKERDRVAGVWYAYHPVAGALTVLRDHGAAAGGGAGSQQQRDVKSPAAAAGATAAGAGKGGKSGGARPLVQVLSEPTAAATKASASAAAAAPTTTTAAKVAAGGGSGAGTDRQVVSGGRPTEVAAAAGPSGGAVSGAPAPAALAVAEGRSPTSPAAASPPAAAEPLAAASPPKASPSLASVAASPADAAAASGDGGAGGTGTTVSMTEAVARTTKVAVSVVEAPPQPPAAAEAAAEPEVEDDGPGLDDPE